MHIPSLLGVSRPIYGSADYTANELDLKTHVDYFRFGYKSTNKVTKLFVKMMPPAKYRRNEDVNFGWKL